MRDYRHKIDFLQRVTGQDDYGEPVDTWTNYKTGIWASYEPLLGNEFFTAHTTDNKVEAKFNMRYVEGVTSKMRLRFNNKDYEIIGEPINVKGLNRELLCYCKLVG
jgi:SPP1 family predicted phage head-tail adaptor